VRIRICAVGRLRDTPEAALVADWRRRFDRAGRPIGLGPLEVVEFDDRKAADAAARFVRAISEAPVVCAPDERGTQMSSPEFAAALARWRDAGSGDLAFAVGGADGLPAEVRDRANTCLSFGSMVWPHALARAMLTEQLYRAATILGGSPYHRG
jgi:23S rRNA (pseudouridine1915-N3)-methyltransferase